MKTKRRYKMRISVPVASFQEEGGDALHMTVAAGESGLTRHITEAAINRPGLALTGFYKYFAHRRIQVLGFAEYAYLLSLDSQGREQRLRSFFERKIPCLAVARGQKILPEIAALAEEFRVPVLRTKMVTKHFINAATIIMENLSAPRMTVQGTMVEIMGIGVLIEGKSGTGKSETALGLIRKGHALVSDDITSLRLDSAGAIIGSPVNVTRYHMEIKGLGIIHVPSVFGVASIREEKRLDLVTTLCDRATMEREDADGIPEKTRELFGIKVPQRLIPVAPGRDLSNIVEAAALDQKLKCLGHDAVKELDERLIARMSRSRNGCE